MLFFVSKLRPHPLKIILWTFICSFKCVCLFASFKGHRLFLFYFLNLILKINSKLYNIYTMVYQWRLVSFQPGDAVQKITHHFLKFFFNFRFFGKCHRIRHHFCYFSNLTLDLKKIYFGTFTPNDTSLCE